jgi:chorismate mutase
VQPRAEKGKRTDLPAGSMQPKRRPPNTLVQEMKMASDEVLAHYRESIDNIDAALVFMLAERFKITKAVGAHKARTGLPPADPAREKAQVERLRSLARSANLDPDFSEKFLRFIIDEVIHHHERVRAG